MKPATRISILMMAMALAISGTAAWGADGLQAKITNAVIDDSLIPQVTLELMDGAGNPLSMDEVSVRGIILARLDVINAQGSSRYFSYTTRTQTAPDGPNAGRSEEQATYDSGGEFVELAPGRYLYIFNAQLPADFAQYAGQTHTVSAQIQRNVGELTFYANPLYHFLPNGGDVEVLRQVATTEGCNVCHTSLGIHGGGRKDVTLCLTCHNPQSVDPDTGNTVDMNVMIHKIHMGANLPSVQAGEPYVIVGHRQSVHDYSDVVYPMDVRNCESCHTGPDGGIAYRAPSRATCGSCHDDVNFQTGAGHGPGIPQMDDNGCAGCHPADGPEFGLSVRGAHTIPFKSQALKGLNAEIVEVLDALPGQMPIVRYRVTENDGALVDPATVRTVAITYASQAVEYTHYVREDATNASLLDGDTYTYTFQEALPVDAFGTYSFGMEVRRDVTLVDNPGEEPDITVTEAADNPVVSVAVTGGAVASRREIISMDKCNSCHDKLSIHGSLRNNLEYCVFCHNPKESDLAVRPPEVGGGESISLDYMVHKIHMGHNLSQGYTVYGFRSSEHDYSHVLFPGIIQECSICHVGDDLPSLPVPAAKESIEFVNLEEQNVNIPPTTSVCVSCHDMRDSVAHAELNTTGAGVESCTVCHGSGRNADIAMGHGLKVFLDVSETVGPPPTRVQGWQMFETAF